MGRRQLQGVVTFFFAVAFLGAPAAADPLFPPFQSIHDCSQLQEEPAVPEPVDVLDEARTKVGEGDFETAAVLLNQYLLFNPDDSQARLELGRVYSWDGRYEEALQVYNQLVEAEGFDSDLRVERAQVIGWTGDYPAAEAAVQAVLAVEPEHIDANLLLASLLEWQGRTEESQKVYQWVLKLDPNSGSAGTASEPQEPGTAGEWLLRFANQYVGDINGFTRFGSRLGLRLPVLPLISLTPFAMASVMDDSDNSALWGAGGGLAIDWRVAKKLSMGVEGGALYYFDLSDQVDWQASLRASSALADWLHVSLRLHTELYGEAGQSLAALVGGVRTWGGDLSTYMASGRFEMFAMLTLLYLDRPDYTGSLVTTGMATPRIRLFGDEHRLFLGYKLWFTGHSEASPLIYNYWSPARYLSHHLLLHLKGPIGGGSYYIEAGAGVGHEFEPESGVGTDSFVEENWSFFPVAQAGAGLRLPLTTRLELELGGWATYSKRLEGSLSNEYMLWFLEANLNYRWSR